MKYEDLIKRLPRDFDEQVVSAKKRYNDKIRPALESQLIRLNLRGSEKTGLSKVTVTVESARGTPIFQHINNRETSLADFLQPHKRDIQNLAESSRNVRKLIDDMENQVFKQEEIEKVDHFLSHKMRLDEVHDLALDMQKLLSQASLMDLIYNLQEDILGYYTSSNGKEGNVVLYNEPIALVANDLGVRIESITAVVLIHELAHAYTHLGRDKENAQWDTKQFFRRENLGVIEGLAQYYTDVISQSLGDTDDVEVHQAYLALRRKQSGVYRIHDRWMTEYSPEVMRDAFIKFRRNHDNGLPCFEDRLKAERQDLMSHPPQLHYRVHEDIEKYGPLGDENDLEINNSLVEIHSEEQLFLPLEEFLKEQDDSKDHLPLLRESRARYDASNWKFSPTRKYIKATQSLVKSILNQINDAITEIANDPMTPRGDTIKPLKMGKGFYRYRIGDNRLVYYVDRLNTNISLYDFGSRGGIYD